ncbi:MAG: hypothetical protein C0404_03010 [Verrucomicrobia bacterium]|nr:hypothetical protein [Verrucomicrobiota bacterium]
MRRRRKSEASRIIAGSPAGRRHMQHAGTTDAGAKPAKPALAWLWLVAVPVTLLLYAANLRLGDLNQDEGWYLYGASLVAEGRKPYIDFAHTQGPLMPYVYSLSKPMVDRWGIEGGRVFTALLGALGVLLAALFAGRLAPAGSRNCAALLAVGLTGINVYQSYFTTIVKTYSLTAFLLLLGFWVLAHGWQGRNRLYLFMAGVFMMMAAGTRTSAVLVLPAVVAGLFAGGVRRHLVDALYFAAGAALTGGIIYLPFALKSPDALWFALYEYHSLRSPGTLASYLAGKAGFVSRIAQDYYVACSAMVVALAYRFFSARSGRQFEKLAAPAASETPAPDGRLGDRHLVLAAWLGVGLVSLVHMMTPFPYDDYQVLIYPVFAAAVAGMLAKLANTQPRQAWLSVSVLLLCIASAFSSPINQRWLVAGRDRIWWPLRKETPLAVLHRAAETVKTLAAPGTIILTQDPYLAVEAGLKIPRGLELGPFSYFPGFTRERAERLHVLNREMFEELVESTDARVAAFSEYGLAISSPEVVELPAEEQKALWEIVEKKYAQKEEIAGFGQGDTKLRILAVK